MRLLILLLAALLAGCSSANDASNSDECDKRGSPLTLPEVF